MAKPKFITIRVIKKPKLLSGLLSRTDMIPLSPNPLSAAIAKQQVERTPAPEQTASASSCMEDVTPTREINRLTKEQRYALACYIEQFKLAVIGKTAQQVADDFNEQVAGVHPAFAFGRTVTFSNVTYQAAQIGFKQNDGKFVAADARFFTSLAPAVAEVEPEQEFTPVKPVLPHGIEAVTYYRSASGQVFESLDEAERFDFRRSLMDKMAESTNLTRDEANDVVIWLTCFYSVTPKP